MANQKVILTQEIPGLGSAGDVVDVRNGHARNYLIPRGEAVRWTQGAQQQVEELRANREARQERTGSGSTTGRSTNSDPDAGRRHRSSVRFRDHQCHR